MLLLWVAPWQWQPWLGGGTITGLWLGRHFLWLGKDRILRLMILCPPDPLNLMSLILANQFWIDWDKYSLWEKTFQIIICSIFWPFYTETANNISSVNKYNSIQTINCTTRAIMRRRSPSATGAVSLKQLGWELLIITKPNLLLSHSLYWKPLTGSENWKVFKRWIFSTLDGFDLLICEPAIPQIPTYFHLESSVHNMYEVNSPQRYLSNLSCRWSSTNSLGCADFYRCLNVGMSRHYLICNLYSGLCSCSEWRKKQLPNGCEWEVQFSEREVR